MYPSLYFATSSPTQKRLEDKTGFLKIDAFVKKCGLSEVPAPAKHPHIPSPGSVWSDADKQYWIKLYNTLSSPRIDGKSINFGKPGKNVQKLGKMLKSRKKCKSWEKCSKAGKNGAKLGKIWQSRKKCGKAGKNVAKP